MEAITSEDHNLAAVTAELDARLTRFNEAHAGPLRTRHVTLTVRNEAGAIIAGLSAEGFWNVLHVDVLWVDETYRNQGYGTALLHRAEELAIESSYDFVYLSTFEFQAPWFYARHDYAVIGELPGVPAGSRRQWYCKKLRNAD